MIFVWIGAWIDSLLKPKRGRDPPPDEKRKQEMEQFKKARQRRLAKKRNQTRP
jgi:hypothetical protein